MSFVYPYFLFALSAISIPIIVHLFNFRKYKRIYFSDVSFLKEVKLQTQAVNKLKHLLILIARILTITFLVLAFAQPYFPLNNNKINAGNKTLSIFIDNSFSMEALNTNGSLLEQAKKNAKEIAMAYSPSDKFQLLSQDFEAKHQRLVNRETFLEWLSEIKISASSNSFKDIVTRQKDALKNSDSKTKNAFIISDFQKSNFTFNELNVDTSTVYQLNPVTANKPANVYIDSCWFSTPARQQNASEELTVKICNQSEQTIENIPIKLSINNQQRAISSATLNANECKEIKINFVSSGTGIQNGTFEITDFPITYDDKFYFSYTVISKINVLSIESSDYSYAPKQLYTSDSLFNFVSVSEKNIDYSSLKNFNLVVLNNVNSLSTGLAQELQKFVSNNGSLLVFPGIKTETESYNNFLQRTIQIRFSEVDTVDSKTTTLNYKHPFFANVFEKNPEKIDLPKISNHYSIISTSRSNNEKLLSLANGTPFLSVSKFNKGKIYVCASALNNDFSNFEKHSLLVPVLYKIALNSVSEQNLYSTINNNNTIELKANETNSDNIFRITNLQNTFDVIPEIKINNEYINLFLHNQIKEAGHYSIKNSKNEINSAIAFNYNRSESKFEFYTDEELENEIDKNSLRHFSILKSTEKSLTAVLKEINEGIKLWKYCLLAALAFIAAEIILIRFWKT